MSRAHWSHPILYFFFFVWFAHRKQSTGYSPWTRGAFIYLAVKRRNIQIRKEWNKNKCKPEISVIAGWINAPTGASFDDKLKYTSQNFTACNVGILEKNMKNFTSPFENAQGMIRALFDIARNIILKIRRLVEILRSKLLRIIAEIFGKISGRCWEKESSYRPSFAY